MGDISESDLNQILTNDIKTELSKSPVKQLMLTKISELFLAGNFDPTILDMID